MKTAVDLYQASEQDSPPARREWTGRSVFRLVLAAVVMSAVYFLASLLPAPAEQAEAGSHMLSNFALFWVLGGIVTITMLALSDRRG